MSYYGYEYFCGANVVVAVEGLPLLEAAGMQYSVMESKMPIYGYSSRHYDAVAAGQVIVEGTLLVNYIHQDYLFRAIQRGLGQIDLEPPPAQPLIPAEQADLRALLSDFDQAARFVQSMRDQYWADTGGTLARPGSYINVSKSPHDFMGGVDVAVSFGEQSDAAPYGTTGYLLRDVHFKGRSSVIRIDEETIVEAYPFFARDVFSTRNPIAFGTAIADGDNLSAEEFPETNSVTGR